MAKVIARLSGLVSYSDGSHAQFAVHLDERGNVSYNGKPVTPTYAPRGRGVAEDKLAIRETDVDTNWIELMIAPLTGLALSTSGATTKTVTGLNAEFSGRVTVDAPAAHQPAWEDFIVQFTTKKGDAGILGASVPEGGSGTAWAKATATAALKASLNSLFNLGADGALGLVVS